MSDRYVDSLHAEYRWISMKAGLKSGWAYFRFKEYYGREPTKEECKFKPIVPNENLIVQAQFHMSKYRFEKLCRAYEYAKMSEQEKQAIKRTKIFTAKAKRELADSRHNLIDL